MTDIIDRIRNRIHDAPMPTEHLLDEAADEIERLRAERDHWAGLVSRADHALFPIPTAGQALPASPKELD